MEDSEKLNLLDQHRELPVIAVEMGEWKTSHGPSVLETAGLGPCVGIAIYDPTRRRATLGHLFGDTSEKFIGSRVRRFIGKSDVLSMRAYLGGVGPSGFSEGDIADTRAYRVGLVSLLKAIGFGESQINTQWNTDSFQGVGMKIDSTNGKFEFTISDFSEHIPI